VEDFISVRPKELKVRLISAHVDSRSEITGRIAGNAAFMLPQSLESPLNFHKELRTDLRDIDFGMHSQCSDPTSVTVRIRIAQRHPLRDDPKEETNQPAIGMRQKECFGVEILVEKNTSLKRVEGDGIQGEGRRPELEECVSCCVDIGSDGEIHDSLRSVVSS
jgi:hypothetical protein